MQTDSHNTASAEQHSDGAALAAPQLLAPKYRPIWPKEQFPGMARYRITGYNHEGRPIMEFVAHGGQLQPGEHWH